MSEKTDDASPLGVMCLPAKAQNLPFIPWRFVCPGFCKKNRLVITGSFQLVPFKKILKVRKN